MAGGLRPPSEEQEQQERIASTQGVVFCLEDAQLEVAQVGKVRGGRAAHRLSAAGRRGAHRVPPVTTRLLTTQQPPSRLCCTLLSCRRTCCSTATTTRRTSASTKRTRRSSGQTSATRWVVPCRPESRARCLGFAGAGRAGRFALEVGRPRSPTALGVRKACRSG